MIAELDVPGVVELMDDYKRLFLEKAPLEDDDAIYKTIIVVFTDLPAERAGALFSDVLRPFQSPVPFLFVRHTVLSDWKFFVDDDASLDRWARRFGPAGTAALAQELRRLPWRVARQ